MGISVILREGKFVLFFSIGVLIILFSYANLWSKEHQFFAKRIDTPSRTETRTINKSVGSNSNAGYFPGAEQTREHYDEENDGTMAGCSSCVMEITAYNATVEQCGKADGITASGTYVTEGRTVACNDFPFGTKLLIGENVYVVEDRCGYDNVVDIYFDSYDDAMSWGRRTMEVIVVE